MPTPVRVLIVDDSAVALSFLQVVLRGANYEVETASTGEQGLEKARRDQPNLIVTDSLMPNMDGFELIRQLKTHPETAQIPIIMITSGDLDAPEYANFEPRPDALVTKSAAVDELLEAVSRLVRNGRIEAQSV